MPIYPYFCVKCDSKFDVVKSLVSYTDDEFCKRCNSLAKRQIGRANVSARRDWGRSFNPAFGCVVNSKLHQKELLVKLKGETGRELIEVGNEPVENIHKFYDKTREENRKKLWDEPHEKILAEGLI